MNERDYGTISNAKNDSDWWCGLLLGLRYVYANRSSVLSAVPSKGASSPESALMIWLRDFALSLDQNPGCLDLLSAEVPVHSCWWVPRYQPCPVPIGQTPWLHALKIFACRWCWPVYYGYGADMQNILDFIKDTLNARRFRVKISRSTKPFPPPMTSSKTIKIVVQ